MAEQIIIKTFGGFSISYGDRSVSDEDNRSKKIWHFLEYLIAHHTITVPRSAIVDLLWSDETSNTDPESALKIILHRTRNILDELNIPESKLILSRQSTYSWNRELDCYYDFEEFSSIYKQLAAGGLKDEEQLKLFHRACELYRGDFLPKCVSEDWAANLATGYHSMYLRLIHNYCALLDKYEQYSEMTDCCSRAAALDSTDEGVNYYYILGLYKGGDQNAAIDLYKRVVDMYYNEFGVEPPENFLKLYNEITTHRQGVQADLNTIQDDLLEKGTERGAYICDYSVFRHFYKVEARACARSGISVFICLITINRKKGDSDGSSGLIAKAMDRMQTVITESLRSSDVFARYSANQFIIMLPTACYENSLMIGERLLRNFSSSRPRINADVSYAVKHLEPKFFAGCDSTHMSAAGAPQAAATSDAVFTGK